MHPVRLIGYWRSEIEPRWPDPRDLVDEEWDADVRSRMADYLTLGEVLWASGGWSACRICGCANGSLELTDGVFIWPDGLAHYLEQHAVRLPDAIVGHVLEGGSVLDPGTRLRREDLDTSWWSTATNC